MLPGGREVEVEAREGGDALEILIVSEDSRALLQRHGRDHRVNGGEGDPPGARPAEWRGSLPVGGKSTGLEKRPLEKEPFNGAGLPDQSLQNFLNDNPREGDGLRFGNHAPQFPSRRSGRGA